MFLRIARSVVSAVVSIAARRTDYRTLQWLSLSVRGAERKGLSVRLSDSEDPLSGLARQEVPAHLVSLIRKLGL